MSALERYYNKKGYKVGGYDKTPSALTDALVKEGIDIHFEDNIDSVAVFQESGGDHRMLHSCHS